MVCLKDHSYRANCTAVLRTCREVPFLVTEEERSIPSMPVWRLCSTPSNAILHFSVGHQGGRVGGFLGSWLQGTIRHLLFRYLFLAVSTNSSALTITVYTRQPFVALQLTATVVPMSRREEWHSGYYHWSRTSVKEDLQLVTASGCPFMKWILPRHSFLQLSP